MPKKFSLRRSASTGLRPGPIVMGVASFVVVGLGMFAAFNLTQYDTNNASQAAGKRLCLHSGGTPERVKSKRTGMCVCPDGAKVTPDQKCPGVVTKPGEKPIQPVKPVESPYVPRPTNKPSKPSETTEPRIIDEGGKVAPPVIRPVAQ